MNKPFNQFLETELNAEQKKGVLEKSGPLLIIAGAGSGKTRVITARIANLMLNENVGSEAIIALTFTNKAAKEMQERIVQFLPKDTQLPFIGTFHSYCLRILKTNRHLINSPFFTILDEDDQQKLITGIVQRNNIKKKITTSQIVYAISSIKNKLIEPDGNANHLIKDPIIQDIYTAYEAEKKASKVFDFDDLLLEVLKLFNSNAMFKQRMHETVRHILVDEYQDTNVVQHALLKQLSLGMRNKFAVDSLCVVGDEDQSIYSWRGATVSNIINFKDDFPKTKIYKIEQNYRSVQEILNVANHVIQHNLNRNPKALWSERKGRDRLRLLTCLSEYQEGEVIANCLKAAQEKQKLDTVAILYRAHYQSRAIEEALIRNGLPYKIIGGIQFYERKEIKDLLAYLRLIANPFDRASFFRIINSPTRGLGQKFEEFFYEEWSKEQLLTFSQMAKQLLASNTLAKAQTHSLLNFIHAFDGLTPSSKPSVALERIIVATGYLAFVKNSYEQTEADSRIENIKELMRAIQYMESNKVHTITEFLDEVALMQEKLQQQDDKKTHPVSMMTLHAAKGLEFDTVILCGVEEGVLPSSRSLLDTDSLEEERRLFYVGITRAKERLLMTHSNYRYTYGRMSDQRPSRFIKEIPAGSLPHQDFSYLQPVQLKSFFSSWFGIKPQTNPGSEVMTFGTANIIKSKDRVTEKSVSKSSTISGPQWKLRQPVMHATFGVGIVEDIEVKNNKKTYITAKFKSGVKKVDAQFLKNI